MRFTILLGFSFAWLASGAYSTAGSVQEELVVPRAIEEKIHWISQAELASRGPAVVDELPPSARVAAAGLLRSAESVEEPGPDGCHVVLKGSDGATRETVATKQAQTASHAFLGEVVAAERGLAHGTPATIYEVRLQDLIRWLSDAVVPQTAFVLHYGGSVIVDGRVLCSESSFPAGELPKVGSEVALLADEIILESPLFVNALRGSFYFETPAGRVAAPQAQASEPPKWEDFVHDLLKDGRVP